MEWEPTIAEIAAYRRATGCRIVEIRTTLKALGAEHRRRMLLAIQTQEGTLHDPIEDDPDLGPLIRKVATEATQIVLAAEGRRRLGTCHAIWTEMARILRERHGLEWFSPARMNLHAVFD